MLLKAILGTFHIRPRNFKTVIVPAFILMLPRKKPQAAISGQCCISCIFFSTMVSS
ncbi:uncharacterized protein M6B38_382115 [Iris pallida]|uniref:Uncharacterized protein n=1 Tax=Iris pallida TaxID=29817 RepID=A0AAX6G8B9_IRIPA|nr:uncharacterized protein M6B38_382110 [Iris pallida]KAJ6824555.1 uncharacterized protein M6B38_382115 [Iris pallida]